MKYYTLLTALIVTRLDKVFSVGAGSHLSFDNCSSELFFGYTPQHRAGFESCIVQKSGFELATCIARCPEFNYKVREIKYDKDYADYVQHFLPAFNEKINNDEFLMRFNQSCKRGSHDAEIWGYYVLNIDLTTIETNFYRKYELLPPAALIMAYCNTNPFTDPESDEGFTEVGHELFNLYLSIQQKIYREHQNKNIISIVIAKILICVLVSVVMRDYLREFFVMARENLFHRHNINTSQSTHTDSVHESTSKSATNLFQSYGSKVDQEIKVEALLEELTHTIAMLHKSSKNEAAIRCVEKIRCKVIDMVDASSSISIKTLLALAFLAINDNERRIGEYKDAEIALINGLYECVRGGNLDLHGNDDGGWDSPICAGGTFNKIIESLTGIHQDCEIIFITQALANIKLMIVVREEAVAYLITRANPINEEEFTKFKKILKDINKNGLGIIYDDIQGLIKARVYAEYHSLYSNISSPAFIAFIAAGVEVDLRQSDFNTIYDVLKNSPYCRNMKSSFTTLFSTSQSDSIKDYIEIPMEDPDLEVIPKKKI